MLERYVRGRKEKKARKGEGGKKEERISMKCKYIRKRNNEEKRKGSREGE